MGRGLQLAVLQGHLGPQATIQRLGRRGVQIWVPRPTGPYLCVQARTLSGAIARVREVFRREGIEMPKFQERPARNTNEGDEKGDVRIIVQLVKGGYAVKGNRSRSLTLADTRVSVVHEALRKALTGD